MDNKLTDLYALVQYLNKSRFTTLDDEISMFLFENRYNIKQLNLTDLANKGYFSQASFSRFFKKYGVKNYSSFKISMAESILAFDYDTKAKVTPLENKNITDIKDDVINKMEECLQVIKDISMDRIMQVVQDLATHKRIVFMGSDFSMAAICVLQVALISHGVHCYALYDPTGQENFINYLDEDDLVICISIKQRWYSADYSTSTIKKLHQSKCRKMLWTLDHNHQDQDKFDDVFFFGVNINEYGYEQLMIIVPIILHIFLKLYCCNDSFFSND